ncbi:MAG: hypothetical protein DI527_01140 [Chelatococcus sp.]|nr:MAG: hypothetical protein DI527_01140 [Chelatococcus sp.]
MDRQDPGIRLPAPLGVARRHVLPTRSRHLAQQPIRQIGLGLLGPLLTDLLEARLEMRRQLVDLAELLEIHVQAQVDPSLQGVADPAMVEQPNRRQLLLGRRLAEQHPGEVDLTLGYLASVYPLHCPGRRAPGDPHRIDRLRLDDQGQTSLATDGRKGHPEDARLGRHTEPES